MLQPRLRVGISGWRYPPWRGTFFPKDLAQKDELHYASRQLPTIEINGTFYSLQRPTSFRAWERATPDDFVFSVKAPRFITHIRRLKEVDLPVANFLASGILLLGPKLGPLLWQLPPSLPYDRERMEKFLALLPHSVADAMKLARRHDPRFDSALPAKAPKAVLRHAIEVRHASFQNEEFVGLLRQYDVALVVADTAGKWPVMEDICSDFMYLRLHGDEQLYVSGYTPEALRIWEKKIRAWSRGANPAGAKLTAKKKVPAGPRDIFVYFDNDVKVRAPFDAQMLLHFLGLRSKPENPHLTKKQTSPEPRTHWPGTKTRPKPPGKEGARTRR